MSELTLLRRVVETLSAFNDFSIAFRIVLAALMGGCIGSERGRHGRAAGFRTHILVCVGSAVTAIVGLYVNSVLSAPGDPMRLGAQVISGIGFLGAGTILTRNQSHITGLTTAAGLWATASIGLAVGVGYYWAATCAFLVVGITISILSRWEKIFRRSDFRIYYVELCDMKYVNPLLESLGEGILSVQVIPPRSDGTNHVGLLCGIGNQDQQTLDRLRTFDFVDIVLPDD